MIHLRKREWQTLFKSELLTMRMKPINLVTMLLRARKSSAAKSAVVN